MMKIEKLAAFILISYLLVFSIYSSSFGQQASPQEKAKETEVKKAPEKIVPSPHNIKEKTAIYVFLAWMWVSILVLIYILRQKIREVDRLYTLKFLGSDF